MMTAYYNEWDPFAAEWLRNLMAAGLIMEGTVDERSIADVKADDLVGFTRVHLFAGISGWDLALQLAGWPSDRPVWTGSCPCQPLSCAGRRAGEKDERHLWPELYRLISECRPATVIGEQVASKDGLEWLDGVSLDLEELGYAVGTRDLPAAGFGAPHIRQRVYWMAYANLGSCEQLHGYDTERGWPGQPKQVGMGGRSDRMAVANSIELQREPSARQQPEHEQDDGAGGLADSGSHGPQGTEPAGRTEAGVRQRSAEYGTIDRLAHAKYHRCRSWGAECQGQQWESSSRGASCIAGLDHAATPGPQGNRPEGLQGGDQQQPSQSGSWSDCLAIPCRDGKSRRISAQPGDEPLAHGIPTKRSDPRLGYLLARLAELGFDPNAARGILRDAKRNRVGALRGAGNAIVPQVAAMFIRAFMEVT